MKLILVAALCLAAVLVLGYLISSRPPTRLDMAAIALRGGLVPLAEFFTGLGRWYGATAVCFIAIAAALSFRAKVGPFIVLAVAQLLSQGVNMWLKDLFQRVRPAYYLIYHEPDYSYPSGHAVTAALLFAGLAVLVWGSSLSRPVASVLAGLLLACALGIAWSRLALGAHYLTDVIGGLLFGSAWLCVVLAIVFRAAPVR